MNPDLARTLTLSALRYFADRPQQTPDEWCAQNLRFDEPSNKGPFSFAGREYIRECLRDFANTLINDSVSVMGSQTGKSAMLMGGAAWAAVNDPCGFLWVMPSMNLAQRFTRKRWIPMLRASPGTADLLPSGARRHDVKTLEQRVGAAAFTFVGSNSAANLASDPCRRVVLDEVDKFDTGGREEADAVNLAEQRTKGQPNPQRFKTSTPTIPQGLIWQEALKGDMRRYFVPCPECGVHHPASRRVVLAWSPQYTMLPKTGREAYVFWDPEAKRKNARSWEDYAWDLDRVERSAHFRCPHCSGKILDANKTWMNREGIWEATRPASSGFVSRHLPSLYACAPETTVGKLAKKFLEQKNSLLGLQGFINGDLAEPYQSQDRQSERTELITSRIEVTASWKRLMGIDCQAKSPNFWHTKTVWSGREVVVLSGGSIDTWDEIRDLQSTPGAEVRDVQVVVDSGHGARSDADVYANCARFGEFVPREEAKPFFVGWMPAKGMPVRKRWKDAEGVWRPYYLRSIDPFEGTSSASRVNMGLLEFSGEYFLDIIDAMRRGQGGYAFKVLEACATEEFWRHMDSHLKIAVQSKTGRVEHKWQPRSKHWPDHMLDTIKEQFAYAAFLGLLELPKES
jgi:hypothetical protein